MKDYIEDPGTGLFIPQDAILLEIRDRLRRIEEKLGAETASDPFAFEMPSANIAIGLPERGKGLREMRSRIPHSWRERTRIDVPYGVQPSGVKSAFYGGVYGSSLRGPRE